MGKAFPHIMIISYKYSIRNPIINDIQIIFFGCERGLNEALESMPYFDISGCKIDRFRYNRYS